MAASAPYMKQCTECNEPIDNYTDKYIKDLEDSFGEIEDFQAFLSNYKKYPSLVKYCMNCLPVKKWELIKSKNRNKQKKPLKNYRKIVFIFMIPIIIILLMYVFSMNTENKSMTNEELLKSTISKFKDQFPSLQISLLKKIVGAFSRLKSPGVPFILLLLHNDLNKKNTDCLASYTSIIAKQNIFIDTPKSLWINASEWTSHTNLGDKDLWTNKLMITLKENEVLVLENLQDLPWSLANSLHHLCDTENPLIAKAMYILELKVTEDGLNQLSDHDKILVAEHAMNTAWIDAPNSFRAALISRLTSLVDAVFLRSDQECSNSLLSIHSEESFIRISPLNY